MTTSVIQPKAFPKTNHPYREGISLYHRSGDNPLIPQPGKPCKARLPRARGCPLADPRGKLPADSLSRGGLHHLLQNLTAGGKSHRFDWTGGGCFLVVVLKREREREKQLLVYQSHKPGSCRIEIPFVELDHSDSNER